MAMLLYAKVLNRSLRARANKLTQHVPRADFEHPLQALPGWAEGQSAQLTLCPRHAAREIPRKPIWVAYDSSSGHGSTAAGLLFHLEVKATVEGSIVPVATLCRLFWLAVLASLYG
jgi:hypothetical protein